MKKPKTSTGAGKAKKNSAKGKDPFAVPPHPLGYNFLSEERPLRASRPGSAIASIAVKYGLGRKTSVERFEKAWRETLAVMFDDDPCDPFADEGAPGRLALFERYARLTSFRGGVLRIEIASNLLYQEFQFRLPEALAEMKKRLPDENIQQIRAAVR